VNGRIPVAARRRLIGVVITLAVAELALQAAEVRHIHHSAPVMALGIFFPVLSVLSGLLYLRSTRERS
jgi:hypothetical protein